MRHRRPQCRSRNGRSPPRGSPIRSLPLRTQGCGRRASRRSSPRILRCPSEWGSEATWLTASLGGEPGRVEHPEVDRCGDDDRAARDGRYRRSDLAASLLLPDGESERHRAPDDQKAAEEGDAARDKADDVCEHLPSFAVFRAVAPKVEWDGCAPMIELGSQGRLRAPLRLSAAVTSRCVESPRRLGDPPILAAASLFRSPSALLPVGRGTA